MKIKHEKMRIAGEKRDGDSGEHIAIVNPYNNEQIGSVPRASRHQVAHAFTIAADYTPTLSRYERQQILIGTATLLRDRKQHSNYEQEFN